MTPNPSAKPGPSPITGFDAERFEVSRIATTEVNPQTASITFEITVGNHRIGQKVFCGLLDRELRSGMGIAVDTMNGELTDLVNDQGIIGYLNTTPIPEGKPFTIRLTMDKFGATHICSARIAGEKILYPSVLLDTVREIGAVVGSTTAEVREIEFVGPRLAVNPSATVAA